MLPRKLGGGAGGSVSKRSFASRLADRIDRYFYPTYESIFSTFVKMCAHYRLTGGGTLRASNANTSSGRSRPALLHDTFSRGGGGGDTSTTVVHQPR